MPVDSIDSFVEALIISMCGCGVGYSVEGRYVANLPEVKLQYSDKKEHIIVEDSSDGWANAARTAFTASPDRRRVGKKT